MEEIPTRRRHLAGSVRTKRGTLKLRHGSAAARRRGEMKSVIRSYLLPVPAAEAGKAAGAAEAAAEAEHLRRTPVRC